MAALASFLFYCAVTAMVLAVALVTRKRGPVLGAIAYAVILIIAFNIAYAYFEG